MSKVRETQEKLVCPTCGYSIPFTNTSGITLVYAIFPEDIDLVYHFLKSNLEQLPCNQCGTMVPYDHCFLCMIRSEDLALIYVPLGMQQENPSLHSELTRLKLELEIEIEIEMEIEMEIILQAAEYKRRLAIVIYPIVITILNNADNNKWILDNICKLDKSFFTALALILNGAIPFYAFISKDENILKDQDLHRVMSSLGPFHLRIVSEVNLGKKDITELICAMASKILSLRVFHLIEFLFKEKKLSTIEEEIANVFPSLIIHNTAVKTLSEDISGICRSSDIPDIIKYASCAVVAAVFNHWKVENPCQNDWATWYVAFEDGRLDSLDANSAEGLVVPLDFAKRTISDELLWDKLAVIYGMACDNGNIKEAINRISTLDKYFDLNNLRHQMIVEYFPVLDNISKEQIWKTLNVVTQIVIEGQEGNLQILKSFLYALARREILWVAEYGEELRYQLFQKGLFSQAVWTTNYVSSFLNKYRLPLIAQRFINELTERLKEMELWPLASVDDYCTLLTEEGNALRTLGQKEQALYKYQEIRTLSSDDMTIPNVRVNERNMAIVLRELNKPTEAIKILNCLLSHTELVERSEVLHSLSECFLMIGEISRAADALNDAISVVPKGNIGDFTRLRLLISLGLLEVHKGKTQEAIRTANDALLIAKNLNDTISTGMAAMIFLKAYRSSMRCENTDATNKINEYINILKRIISLPEEYKPQSNHLTAMQITLAETLAIRGSIDEADKLLDGVVPKAGSYNSLDWAVLSLRARFASQDGDHEHARTYLNMAHDHILNTVDSLQEQNDNFQLLWDKEYLQAQMAEEFIRAYKADKAKFSDLRRIADFQASLILSRKLWGDEEKSFEANAYEDNNLCKIAMLETNYKSVDQFSIIQAFKATSGVYMLLTRISEGSVTNVLTKVGEDIQQIQHLTDLLLNKIRMWSPAREGTPISGCLEWHELSNIIYSKVRSLIAPGTILCIIPGPLTGLPLHWILGSDYPLSYFPSLQVALVLHNKRLKLDGGSTWRPRTFSDFVVWRYRERPNIVNCFLLASEKLSRDLLPLGIETQIIKAENGTREALLEALQNQECVRISCHGSSRPHLQRFELLVSVDGELPPADPMAIDSDIGKRFLLNWSDINKLTSCAPIVFSAACSSGISMEFKGGERIGLERPLLRAGALAYISPEWPVPVEDIQGLINNIITRYFGNPKEPLSVSVFKEVNLAIKTGVPEWVARSIAIHGDWL